MMAMARQTLHGNMGRPASYTPPDGSNLPPTSDLIVRYTSAVETITEMDIGNERYRAITVQVQIGTGAGQLPVVQLGGVFVLDVDGVESEWTVHSFPNADVPAGFVRCLVLQRIKQSLAVGDAKPRK